jgi:hypothetical protein
MRRRQSKSNYYRNEYRLPECKCGCGNTVPSRRAVFYNATCRKRHQRVLDRLESKNAARPESEQKEKFF